MAYKINYDHNEQVDVNVKGKVKGRNFAVLLIVLLFVLCFVTPIRRAALDFLIPGDSTVTTRAASDLLNNLKNGQPMKEAFTDFCIEIVENG